MGLLDGKNIVITGVLTDASLAFGVATLAQEEGAEIVLTGAGRALSLTQRTGRKLPDAGRRLRARRHRARPPRRGPRRAGRASGAASTACCTPSASRPAACLGDDFMDATVGRRGRRAARQRLLAEGAGRRVRAADDRRRLVRRARLRQHRGLAGLQLDGRGQVGARERQPLPGQASSGRRGIRSNLVAAGPVQDHGGQEHPRLQEVRGRRGTTAPRSAGTSPTPSAVAKACVALLSATGSRPPPARSSTSTAATTPSARAPIGSDA